MSRFDNKKLDGYDVMQHIHNLYDIIGTTGTESIATKKSQNVKERLDEIQNGNFINWKGTMEEYKVAVASGLVKPTDLCAITDDYVEPPNNN